jgi:hypothetical protein
MRDSQLAEHGCRRFVDQAPPGYAQHGVVALPVGREVLFSQDGKIFAHSIFGDAFYCG